MLRDKKLTISHLQRCLGIGYEKSNLFFLEPTTKDENWSVVNMGFGNYLFVRNDYIDQFKEKTKDFGRGQIYQNWVKIAKELLK